MGIFSWIILGLIAGALAKWVMPGKDPGGFLGSFLGKGGVNDLSIGSIITAIVGAIVLLYLYRVVKK